MVNWNSKKFGDFLLLGNGLMAVVLLNLLASLYFFRMDLTDEKRYSINASTKGLLQELDDKVYVEVFLEGELNAGFRRFQKSIRETLEEFRIYSDNRVEYVFTDPATAVSEKARNEFMASLAEKGIQPTRVVDSNNGERIEKIIFPGALVSYGGNEIGVPLLKGNKARTPDEEINQSIEGIEYEVANAISKLYNTNRKRIGLVTGHGELDSLEIAAFNNILIEQYDVFRVNLLASHNINLYDALIIVKPKTPFSEIEKFKLDQYIMRGGKVMFLIDKMEASMREVMNGNQVAMPYESNLDDLLFKYGVRINMDLVADQSAVLYPVVINETGGKPQMQMLKWPFYPLINHYAEHPITRNIDAVVIKFGSSIDTVKSVGVRKTPLFTTSSQSRIAGVPVVLDAENILRQNPATFTSGRIPMGYLLEGSFTSLYKNRLLPEGVDNKDVRATGVPTRLVVFSDGDLARNEINPKNGQPQPLGFDPFTNYTFANHDLLMNALSYLLAENGLIEARRP